MTFKTFSLTALTLALFACGGQQQAQKTEAPASAVAVAQDKNHIVIGTTVGDFADMVRDHIKPELEKKGYQVELKEFTDYVQPNVALADKNIDLNVMQHKPYLDHFKAEHKLDLTEVFQVPTAPLGLYAGKSKTLNDIKEGAKVSAANDPSNFARALVMFNDLGWLKLKEGINPLTASKNDIAENTKKLEIVELEAAQLPRSRDDVDFAVINGNYATDAGIKLTDTLFLEPSFAYVNWAVVRTEDQDSKWVKDVEEAYNAPSFKEYAKQKFAGYKYPASWNENPAGASASH